MAANSSAGGSVWPQIGEDAGLGCATSAASNLDDGFGGLGSGFLSGGVNGVGFQMIGLNWNPRKVNYWWALFDGLLGAEENRAVSYDTENPSVKDLSTGNSLSGGLGVVASGVCGILDRFTKANC